MRFRWLGHDDDPDCDSLAHGPVWVIDEDTGRVYTFDPRGGTKDSLGELRDMARRGELP